MVGDLDRVRGGAQPARSGEQAGEEGREEARVVLDLLTDNWSETLPDDEVRSLVAHLSGRHPLKAADALQLAAALVWCEQETEDRKFVCLDDKLRRAASDEGFDILPEEEAE